MISSMLKRDNQVLWAAERERPDFAGKEGDDNFFDSMATTDEMVREPDSHSLSALPDREEPSSRSFAHSLLRAALS